MTTTESKRYQATVSKMNHDWQAAHDKAINAILAHRPGWDRAKLDAVKGNIELWNILDAITKHDSIATRFTA